QEVRQRKPGAAGGEYFWIEINLFRLAHQQRRIREVRHKQYGVGPCGLYSGQQRREIGAALIVGFIGDDLDTGSGSLFQGGSGNARSELSVLVDDRQFVSI